MVHRYHCHSNIWMLVCKGYIVIIIILGRITPNLLHNIVLATLFACFRAAVCFRATCVSFLVGTLSMAADNRMWADSKFSLSFWDHFFSDARLWRPIYRLRTSWRSFCHSTYILIAQVSLPGFSPFLPSLFFLFPSFVSSSVRYARYACIWPQVK